MYDKVFIDTNILIYSYSEDEKDKQEIASNILDRNNDSIIISKQVINELSNILFKKFHLTSEKIENVILEIDNEISIVDFNLATQIKAIRLKDKYKLQFYDAVIVATALENHCNILYSEDMQHNQVIENKLTIINPFEKLKT
jgi:predicted nucleic acid-binding protein